MKPILLHIWTILKHPVTGVTAGAVVSAYFYFIGIARVEPRFASSPAELLAEKSAKAPMMSIMWNTTEVANVRSADVALWNGGRMYIDNALVSPTEPIQIRPSVDISILSAQPIVTSRTNLHFATSISGSNLSQVVTVDVVGDEALEEHDGCIIKILFTGDAPCEFSVTGRIKGCSKGFERVDWADVKYRTTLRHYIVYGLGTVFCAYYLIVGIKELKTRKLALGTMSLALSVLALANVLMLLWGASLSLSIPAWLR